MFISSSDAPGEENAVLLLGPHPRFFRTTRPDVIVFRVVPNSFTGWSRSGVAGVAGGGNTPAVARLVVGHHGGSGILRGTIACLESCRSRGKHDVAWAVENMAWITVDDVA